MKKINTAIIGIGNIGYLLSFDKKRSKKTWSHFSAYNKIKEAKLVAVLDSDRKKIYRFKKKNKKINCYTSLTKMIKENDIDLVSICTPAQFHFKNIIELLKLGIKGIICEKPIVINLSQARKVYEITKNKLFYLNHQRRYDPNYQKIKKIINSKRFGNIKSVTVFYPGQLYNILSHVIDILRFLLNDNPKMVSFIERFYGEKEKSATGYIIFENDIITNIVSTGQREKLIFELDFISDKGRVKIQNNGNKIVYSFFKKSKDYSNYYELGLSKNLRLKNSDPLLSLIKDAVVNYKSKKRSEALCSAKDGFYVISTIKAIEKSINKNGKIYNVEKI